MYVNWNSFLCISISNIFPRILTGKCSNAVPTMLYKQLSVMSEPIVLAYERNYQLYILAIARIVTVIMFHINSCRLDAYLLVITELCRAMLLVSM